MRRNIFIGLTIVSVIIAALAFIFGSRIRRIRLVASLFTGAEQHERFNRVYEIFPSKQMPASAAPLNFPTGPMANLPQSFGYKGQSVNTDTFLRETDTSALLVLKNGEIVYENYWLTGGRDVQWLSMSVAKSFVSALVGIAVEEGHIKSIEDPITQYAPSLAESAYDNVRIKDVLQMSSGARWNEDYSDRNSDVLRFGRAFATGSSLNDFVGTLEREFEPGTFNRYNSADTQALGLLLVNATGRTISDYMDEKLWQPMGAESTGYWLLDNTGMEMAFGGMALTARDYAKIGELYRLKGQLNGNQILSAEWVAASTTPDAPHLQPGGSNPGSDFELGYGYQWWIPESTEGEFSAIGVYNQFVYVNPTQDVVIAKLSAKRDYATTLEESSYRELETIELFRAIVGATSGNED